MIIILQSWDDGVVDDIRLTDLLRRYGAMADFNLTPGLYVQERAFGWRVMEKPIYRLGWDECKDVYEGFDIGSHSMTHPGLTTISDAQLDWELRESKARLEAYFNRAITGFCYPFNIFSSKVMEAVKAAGYTYARGLDRTQEGTSRNPRSPYAMTPDCHFLEPGFWDSFVEAREAGRPYFYFWGHSYELMDESQWLAFEKVLERFSDDPETKWGRIGECANLRP